MQYNIRVMILDIKKYLLFKYNKDYQTKQVDLVLKALFCGYIIKQWIEKTNDYSSLNKIIVKECILFCIEC